MTESFTVEFGDTKNRLATKNCRTLESPAV